jgi:hypothetical protein
MKKPQLLLSTLFLALTLTFASASPALAGEDGPQGIAKSSPVRPEAPSASFADVLRMIGSLIGAML